MSAGNIESAMQVDLLPPWARRLMAQDFLSKGAGGELRSLWYEYPSRSNFDKLDRQKIRDAAEEDLFVVYRGSTPYVTDAGLDWARGELK